MPFHCGLEKISWESLGLQGDQPVHPKGNQSLIFIGRTDVEAETLIFWPRDAKNWLIWEDPDAGKDWRQEEKETTENEMVGWHHRLYGRGFEQVPEAGDGQGNLVCCSPWGRRLGHDWAAELNWGKSSQRKKKENCLSSGFKVSLESRKTHMREAEGCLCWKVWRWRITHWVRGTTRVWTDCKRSFRGSVRWGREPGHAGCYKSSLWGLKCLTGSSGSGIGPVSVIVMKWASKL